MFEFNELKADILQRARDADACSDEYKRAYGAETKAELLQVIVDNIAWCYNKEMLDTPYMIDNFSDLFEQFGIYATGHHEIENRSVVLLGSSTAAYELKGDYSTIKDLNNRKLLVKKSKFEIVEV
ncbi:MAG: hypothetical protein LBV41_03005 [Cytophagaceae bacterium]|jgi:hypothetical protein|nr:hypothetical protein [Cytophagaceae bacterium]